MEGGQEGWGRKVIILNKLVTEKMMFGKGLKGVSYMALWGRESLFQGLASAKALG